jgi:ATP-binding cassette subfamily B protein
MARASRTAAARELGIAGRGFAIQAALAAATAIVAAGSTWVIVGRVIEGRASLGAISLFLAAVAGIQSALNGVMYQLAAAGRHALTFRSYLEVMDLASAPVGQLPAAPALRHGLELRDAWFRYTPDGPWVLRGVDLWIPAGETVGLVGLNGAGKTTLIKLLCRFYELERGQILWDGTDVRALDPGSLYRRISATFQDFMTYELSAADNVGLGDPAALDDHARIRAAARLAGIEDQLAALPDGFATLLSRTLVAEDAATAGTTLSVGQWQRVALARSLMRPHADLLLLDEPSAGLDAEAEHHVHRTIARHGAGRTRLLISHRLSSLRGADRIAVLDQGRICELGSHAELIARGGAYARLFSLQAAGYRDADARAEAACS